jgi:aspartate-semialdehyde dehydrogenase
MAELLSSTADYLAKKPVENKVFVHPIAFNLIPHIDKFQVSSMMTIFDEQSNPKL